MILLDWTDSISTGGTPPQFVGDPNRLHRMKEGANLKLKCPIEGSEPFDIEWFKVMMHTYVQKRV